jgi:hypothetical protein
LVVNINRHPATALAHAPASDKPKTLLRSLSSDVGRDVQRPVDAAELAVGGPMPEQESGVAEPVLDAVLHPPASAAEEPLDAQPADPWDDRIVGGWRAPVLSPLVHVAGSEKPRSRWANDPARRKSRRSDCGLGPLQGLGDLDVSPNLSRSSGCGAPARHSGRGFDRSLARFLGTGLEYALRQPPEHRC